MSNTPTTPTPSSLPAELLTAAEAAGSIAQSILAAEGNAVALVIPLTESLLATAIQAWTVAHGAPPTVAQLQALLPDVPLVPPTQS